MALKLSFTTLEGVGVAIVADFADLESALTGIATAVSAKPAGNSIADDEELGAQILKAIEPITKDIQGQIQAALAAPAPTAVPTPAT
jgi:hypothetical protein